MRRITSVLYGFTFDKRVALDSSNDYCLVFKNGHQFAYALWTTDEPHDVTFSLGPATYVCSDTTGQASRWVRVQTQLITVHLTQSPIYLKSVVRD